MQDMKPSMFSPGLSDPPAPSYPGTKPIMIRSFHELEAQSFCDKSSSKTTLQVWLQVTTTRRARTPSTRTTRAQSPTQITELLLPADSSPSSSIQCPLDTQANECVDVSEFYLSLLDWFYIYMAFHVVSIVYTLSWCKSAQLCVRYGCENICTFVHSLSLNAAGEYQRQAYWWL